MSNFANMSRSELLGEVERLDSLINTPTTDDFLAGVRLEAAHQAERWGIDHDAGKGPVDWLFLVAYLAGKAAAAGSGAHLPYKVIVAAVEQVYEDHPSLRPRGASSSHAEATIMADALRVRLGALLEGKAKHHTVTAAAALANWHAQLSGKPLDPHASMRPGINPAEHGEPVQAEDIPENDIDELLTEIERIGWRHDSATPEAHENARTAFRKAFADFLRERGVKVQNVCPIHELPCDANGDCSACGEIPARFTLSQVLDYATRHDGQCKVAELRDGSIRLYPPDADLPLLGKWAWFLTDEIEAFPLDLFNIEDDRERSHAAT